MCLLFGFGFAAILQYSSALEFEFWLVLISCLGLYFLSLRKYSRSIDSFLFVVGFINASYNNAPLMEEAPKSGIVVLHNVYPAPNLKIFEIESQRYGLVSGRAASGVIEIVKCRDKALLFGFKCRLGAKDLLNPPREFLIDYISKIEGLSHSSMALISALFAGEISYMGSQFIDFFRRLGLIHLLVISGAHISMISLILYRLLALPLVFIYTLGRIDFRRVRTCLVVIRICVIVVVIFFCVMSGMSAPAQRALSVCLARYFFWFMGAPISICKLLTVSLLFQTTLWPVGFVNSSTLMSWVAYLLIVNIGCGVREIAMRVLLISFSLPLVMAIFTGNYAIIFTVSGLIAQFLFPPIILICLGIVLVDGLLDEPIFAPLLNKVIQNEYLISANFSPPVELDLLQRLLMLGILVCMLIFLNVSRFFSPKGDKLDESSL